MFRFLEFTDPVLVQKKEDKKSENLKGNTGL